MKSIFHILIIFTFAFTAQFTAFAKADTTLQIKNAREIKLHQTAISNGLIHENAKIIFIASANVGIHVATSIEDDTNRSYVGGHRATHVQAIAKECFVTIYKPQILASQSNQHMDKLWKETVDVLTNYKQGDEIVVQFYQPDIDIRRSVVERISGLGHARLQGKRTTN